jgi:hypothetical protein
MNDIDKLLTLAQEMDKGRATTHDLNEVAKTLTELVVSFITSTKEENEAFMARIEKKITDRLDRIKDGENGKDGKDGRDGKDGSDGVDGVNGKDADPDEIAALVLSVLPEPKEYLGEDFRNGLKALPEGDKLSIDAIEGLWDELKKLKKTVVSGQAFGASPAMASNPPRHEAFTMDGATSTVTLTQGVAAQGTAVFVRYQGQLLDHGTQYTVNGNTITLTDLPENGTIVSVTYWTF